MLEDVRRLQCIMSQLFFSKSKVQEGENVNQNSLLGFISNKGASNDHLHFVIYEGANNGGELVSVDATLPSQVTSNGNSMPWLELLLLSD